jgi:hypothetical protein
MFMAVLNFTLSGMIFVVAILTLRKVSTPKEVLFASLPLFFALHQFTQGFVWLGTENLIDPRAYEMAKTLFVIYAQGILQFLVPLAVWMLEPKGLRKDLLALLTGIGGILAAYALWELSVTPTEVSVVHGVLYYNNPSTSKVWFALGYVLTTCGSLILSRSIAITLYGILNLIGLTLIYLINPYGFTSVWCLYAAAISVLLYFYFVERRIAFLQAIRIRQHGLSRHLKQELEALEKRYPAFREKIKRYNRLLPFD